MRDCNKENWIGNFERLTDKEFDELIEHSTICKIHADILTDYEQSILPILRASLPEKIIAFSPVSQTTSSLSSSGVRVISWLRSSLRKLIIEINAFLSRRRFVQYSSLLQVGIIAILFFAVVVYGSFAVFTSLRDSTKIGASESQQIDKKEANLLNVGNKKMHRNDSNTDAGKGLGAILPLKIENNRQRAGYRNAPKVSVSVDNFPQAYVNQNDPLTNADMHTDSGIGKPNDQPSLNKTPKSETLITEPQDYIEKYPALIDSTRARVDLRATNLSRQEILNTICNVELKRKPSINSTVQMDNEGMCSFGLRVSEGYVITVTTPGYEVHTFDLAVDTQNQTKFLVMTRRRVK